MIKELGDNTNTLSMYKGDTGTVGFKLTGDCEEGDKYIFAIKETLNDSTPLFSQSFNSNEFTVYIDENTSGLFDVGEYFWGLKLLRSLEDGNEIDTLIGKGHFLVKRGV